SATVALSVVPVPVAGVTEAMPRPGLGAVLVCPALTIGLLIGHLPGIPRPGVPSPRVGTPTARCAATEPCHPGGGRLRARRSVRPAVAPPRRVAASPLPAELPSPAAASPAGERSQPDAAARTGRD